MPPIPAAACAVGGPPPRRSNNSGANSRSRPGNPVFLIGNKYQTASSLSFYMSDHRVEGPGHPPVYTPESQDIENEFAFWPRYDEFVAPPAGAVRADAYYTEEQGVNLFEGRDALFITDEAKRGCSSPRAPSSGASSGSR